MNKIETIGDVDVRGSQTTQRGYKPPPLQSTCLSIALKSYLENKFILYFSARQNVMTNYFNPLLVLFV